MQAFHMVMVKGSEELPRLLLERDWLIVNLMFIDNT